LKGQVSWLTCNNDQCLPGNAELELSLDAGPVAATPEATVVEAALLSVPSIQVSGLNFSVAENAGILSLKIESEPSNPLNLDDYEIFPATPQVINPATKIQFTKNGNVWSTQVPKSEYATKPVKELTLVFAGKSGQAPVALTWKSE
jgi:DsbC/DsbD-like thiol-disulfide interchange protein